MSSARPRRGPDARVHARRDEGDRQDARPRRGSRRLVPRSSSATRTTCISGPGEDVIAELGGLHRFMGWDGPILTDSGGYQVFSLRDTIKTRRRRRRHVPLRLRRRRGAVHAGVRRARSRRSSARTSRCASTSARRPARDELAEAVRLTTLWASAAARRAARRRASSSSASPRAPPTPSSGAARSSEIVELDFDGHALGGLSVGEARDPMFETVADAAPLLPAEKPRYFMGIGDPEGILEVIERGVDMFDCVLPTRMGRTGTALTSDGTPQPEERPLRPRPGAARRALRLPGLLAVHPRVHPAPRQPAGAPRPAAADRPQPPLPAPASPQAHALRSRAGKLATFKAETLDRLTLEAA